MQTFLNHEKGKITQLNHSKDSRYINSVFRARISEWRNTRFDIPLIINYVHKHKITEGKMCQKRSFSFDSVIVCSKTVIHSKLYTKCLKCIGILLYFLGITIILFFFFLNALGLYFI